MSSMLMYCRKLKYNSTPGPVIEPRVHYKVPDFSHLDYLTKALGFQNHRGVRVPDWSQLRNPRWRPAAILKMKFVISSHPIVIQRHVIYQNILFQTRRIHFCHHNWFSSSQNSNIQYGGSQLFRKRMVLRSISAYHQGHALLGTQQKLMDMDSFETQISESVMRLSSTWPHIA